MLAVITLPPCMAALCSPPFQPSLPPPQPCCSQSGHRSCRASPLGQPREVGVSSHSGNLPRLFVRQVFSHMVPGHRCCGLRCLSSVIHLVTARGHLSFSRASTACHAESLTQTGPGISHCNDCKTSPTVEKSPWEGLSHGCLPKACISWTDADSDWPQVKEEIINYFCAQPLKQEADDFHR